MRLKSVKLKNFRGYRDVCEISFESLTAIVGKNDVGKSSILEGLDIFFHDGKGAVSIEKNDLNIQASSEGETEFSITCVFSEVPKKMILDSTFETNLQDEYLLNADGCLEVEKRYSSKLQKVLIHANYPANEKCVGILQMKNSELKKVVRDLGVECDNLSVNGIMRKAIYAFCNDDLRLVNTPIDVTKGDDIKSIWKSLQEQLPCYSLFQSDRKNCESDDEIQYPLKETAKDVLKEQVIIDKLDEVAEIVLAALNEVAEKTYSKLKEMAPDVADGLKIRVPSASELKWLDVFKSVGIDGADGIPINKRGSGVKRLVLLNFFRAEAERKRTSKQGIIYAVEEPETSQHCDYQRLLISALKALSKRDGTQVLITTHSSIVVKELEMNMLRVVSLGSVGLVVRGVEGRVLPNTSLNEAAYLAFGEATEEYHNELWGVIDGSIDKNMLNAFRSGRPQRLYLRSDKKEHDGSPKREQRILSHYIRDVMHHPENTLNPHYTQQELEQSIVEMRSFISQQSS